MIPGLALALVATLADPRPPIADLVIRGEAAAALERIDAALDADRPRGERLGLGYLRGDQLERLGRRKEAAEQFVAALASGALAPNARLRLARLHRDGGEPAVAAGLVATLVAPEAAGSLRREAVDLLRETLAAGGDCRLLAGLRPDKFRGAERRKLELARGECAEREGDLATAVAAATRLLEQTTDDALARDAAELLARATLADGRSRRQRFLLARAAYAHREFVLSRTLFLELLGDAVAPPREWDDGYALARSEFWLGEYDEASRRFLALARAAAAARQRADALFQAGRSLELAGRVGEALTTFDASRAAEPVGNWSGVAQLAALRLVSLGGDETGAESRLGALVGRRTWRDELARGALFLASGRLARGEPQRTGRLLDLARRSGVASGEEVAYWEGRRAELEGSHARAVDAYLEALAADPFHPFARLAAARLGTDALRPATRARGYALATASSLVDLRSAVLLLGPRDEKGAAAADALRARLARLPGTAPWLAWTPVPTSKWPVFSPPPGGPGHLLVALGRLDEAPGLVSRWFSLSDPALAFTGTAALAAVGGHRQSLALVESLFGRRPEEVPIEWVDAALRRQLYPLPFEAVLREQAALRGVDPYLLAAILREESRFDPEAVSPASARGLAQFVVPTARRLARELDLPDPLARDLFRPEVAIALGAGYLAELSGRFAGREGAVVAAYNAGEAQAGLWMRYCSTREEGEFLSKVGFRETRAYLQRVLRSRAHYAGLEAGSSPTDGLSAAAALR